MGSGFKGSIYKRKVVDIGKGYKIVGVSEYRDVFGDVSKRVKSARLYSVVVEDGSRNFRKQGRRIYLIQLKS